MIRGLVVTGSTKALVEVPKLRLRPGPENFDSQLDTQRFDVHRFIWVV